jgi:intracellular multiplication protein IcmP
MSKKHGKLQETTEAYGPMMALVVFVLIGWLLWRAFHTSVSAIVLSIRGVELALLSLFVSGLAQYQQWVAAVPREHVKLGDLWQVSALTGSYFRWVIGPVLIGLAFWVYASNPRLKRMRMFDVHSLALAEAVNWPRGSIANRVDVSKLPLDKGPWALALTELEFVQKYKLLGPKGDLNKARTAQILAHQLGSVFVGWQRMPPHRRALFAIFTPRIAAASFAVKTRSDRDKVKAMLAQSAKLLDQFGASANPSSGYVDYRNADAVAAMYAKHPAIQRICTRHGYETTLLVSLYDAAKELEPLPPADFLWLKRVDRGLWYPLNNLGMNHCYHVEAMGVMSHWEIEKALQRRIEMPMVEACVDGLEDALMNYAAETRGGVQSAADTTARAPVH